MKKRSLRNTARRCFRAGLAGAVLLLVASALFFSCSGDNDWVMFRGNRGRGFTPNALYPPLGVRWKIRLQNDERLAYAFNNPVVKGDTIYFGSTDGNFYALDMESGYMQWVFKTGAAINSVPFADEEKVYFGSNDGNVYAVARDSGKEQWSFQTGRTVQSTIMRYEDTILFTSDGGATYLLTPDGEEEFSIPNPVWYYDTFQVYERVIYFAPGPITQPHSFGAFDLDTRSYLWVLDTAALNTDWYSFPALHDDDLLFATCANEYTHWRLDYYAFDRLDGSLKWHRTDYYEGGDGFDVYDLFEQNLRILDYMAPAIWRNTVIYTSGDPVVRAFHTDDGRELWERRFDMPTSSSPTIAGDRVYFGLRGAPEGTAGPPPRIVCLSARDGRLLWEMEIEGAILSAPVISGQWMVFGTDANYFYVLEELTG